MFRNPRENVDKSDEARLRPSVGRPPTPPASSPAHSKTDSPFTESATSSHARMSGTTTASRPSAPNKPPNGRIPTTPAKSSPVKSASKTKQNSSILNFFKKADGQNGETRSKDDSLFLKESPVKNGTSRTVVEEVSEWEDYSGVDNDEAVADGAETVHENDRFNESSASIKRQKTEDMDFGSPVRHTEDVPPPKDTARNQSGPFLFDSESEDEGEGDSDDEQGADATEDILPQTKPVAESLPKENGHDPQEDVAILKHPILRREGTSAIEGGDFEGFEGMEDFEGADYPEGEEYLERRYMARQRRLEMEEDGFEGEIDDDDLLSIKEELLDDDGPSYPSESMEEAPSCPVCGQSLAGVQEQDISVHVNNCLDGNPTPLPTDSPTTNPPADTGIKREGTPTTSSASFRRPVRPAKPGQQNPFAAATTKSNTSSAFSKLMSGHAESAAWAAAAADENASRGKPAYQRTCPFYKILPGFSICVDAFRYGAVEGCQAYFLSHFHSDHYIGLTSSWRHGPIYASRGTVNLMRQQLGVDRKYLVELEWETWTEVPGTNGVKCYMIPANHCPSSSIYLFSRSMPSSKPGGRPREQRILHCGDFRACPAHISHPLLKPEVMDAVTGQTREQKIDICYLDTTYLNPKYAFPSQEDVIKACADMCVSLNKPQKDDKDAWESAKRERAGPAMTNFLQRNDSASNDTTTNGVEQSTATASNAESGSDRGRLLVVVGTYSIGKERICLGLARALGSKIFAPAAKRRICACLEDPELERLLTDNPAEAQVHMTPLFEIRAETLAEYLSSQSSRFSRAVAFRPTGWNYRAPTSRITDTPPVSSVLYSANWKSSFTVHNLVPQRGSNARSQVFGVPYSEHSSFRELTMFCCALRIDRVIPTVNVGSAKSRERMKGWVERWAQERRKNGLFRVAPPPKEVLEGEEDLGFGVKSEVPSAGEPAKGGNGQERVGDWYTVGGRGTWQLRTTL